jgi:glutamate racemase
MQTLLGIADSGSGGLSIWQSVVSLLPHESTLYIGDHANVPYSEKSTRFIRRRVVRLISYLVSRGAKLIVLACNTATVAGIDTYRKEFPHVPVVGVVPVIKTASEVSLKRSFAVLSTKYTAQSLYQKRLIRTYASDCRVYNLGCTDLVSLVESGVVTGLRVRQRLQEVLLPKIIRTIDTIALGCTHYPFLGSEIRAIVGEDVRILDSGGAVARHVRRILDTNKIRTEAARPSYEFVTTGDALAVTRIARKLTGRRIIFHHVAI